MGFDWDKFFSRAAYNAYTGLLIVWGLLVVSYVAAPWEYHYTVKDPRQPRWEVEPREVKRFPWEEPRPTRIVTQGFVDQRQAFWNKMLLFTAAGTIPIILLEGNWTALWQNLEELGESDSQHEK